MTTRTEQDEYALDLMHRANAEQEAELARLRACLAGIPEPMLTGPGCVAPAITVQRMRQEIDRLRTINAELVAALASFIGAVDYAQSEGLPFNKNHIIEARAALAKARARS